MGTLHTPAPRATDESAVAAAGRNPITDEWLVAFGVASPRQ
jgi:hypothetical protein